ncbi:ROK family transcriptional regulator [Paenibacillus brevis]|uniref:ROK family protein n=1 Tax=Paenibacillus brevis TaxID=2841508 RepID=A0ABS6FMD9_9BACL|nr:ROK family transcriptional regulator [Paenibacillus brevis]MBU5670396.1 ROK family protein [Paenibacillus brevis]
MKITGDQQLIKKMNKGIVLDTIRQKQPLSRADISAAIGLNKATVSSLVAELIDSQLVTEIGPGESSGGRKPTLLLFNKQAGYAVGVDIRVHDLLVVIVDLEGHIIREQSTPLADYTTESVTNQIKSTITKICADLPATPYGIVGIGIGVPGLVNETQQVVSAPNLGWNNFDLAGHLQQEFAVPIHIDNEANAGAIGEKLYGAGLHTNDLVYLSIGVGIGSGIVVGGQLYRGTSNFSGEVGHMTIAENGPLCRCGNHGCWETLASEKALLDQAAGIWGEQVSTIEEVLAKVEEGNSQAATLLNEIGTQLGIGLANLVNILNPEMIVIGNRLSLAGKQLEQAMLHSIEQRSLSYHRKKTQVEFAKLGIRSTALGAASMPITAFLADPDVTVQAEA